VCALRVRKRDFDLASLNEELESNSIQEPKVVATPVVDDTNDNISLIIKRLDDMALSIAATDKVITKFIEGKS